MRKLLSLLLFASLATACVKDVDNSVTEPSANDKIFFVSDTAAPGRLLVRFTTPVESYTLEGAELSVEPLFHNTDDAKLNRWMIVRFDESLELGDIAQRMAQDRCVERIEYDVKVKRIKSESMPMPTSRPEPTRSVTMPFDDPELPWQWHYYNDGSLAEYADDPNYCLAGADINLLNAWKYTTGDNRVIVAVMDGGVMTSHRELADNMWVNQKELNGTPGVDDDGNGYTDDIYGYNFVTNSGNVTADSHGTHVAGTISAVNNNGFAGCGIAGGTGNKDGVRIMSLQIFEGDDGCFSHQIAQAFKYAADNGAVIINNSWGYIDGNYGSDGEYERYDSVIKNATDYFESNARLDGVMEGGLIIFAAGNETLSTASYPGAYRKYICVSAMSSDFTATYYTNYGPGCNIAAPGGDANYGTIFIISSASVQNANSYGVEYMQGTSMATPHVSGCAALAVSYALKQGYTLTSDELRRLILTSVHDINPYQTGSKRVFDHYSGGWYNIPLSLYAGKLGAGYIDAHLLLMQMDNTPCLYFKTGEMATLSLDEFFGSGSHDLTYDSCSASNDVRTALGIETLYMENGMLHIKATRPGSGRITVKAIVGGTVVGGSNNIGGSYVEREFEIVVRGKIAENGGWL